MFTKTLQTLILAFGAATFFYAIEIAPALAHFGGGGGAG